MSFRRYLTGGTSTLIRSRETFITGLFNQQGRRSGVHVRHLRSYSSQTHASSPSPSGQSAQSAILSAALHHVPSHGFTQAALSRGANDAGYLDASLTLFPRGAFDLVNHYLVSQRLALGKNASSLDMNCGVGAKVRKLALLRLRSNSAVIHHWQEALALMAMPQSIAPSLTELARLSDEIWFLAGDTSVDYSWYTKRATLSAVYSSTELFMTTDSSPNYNETENFLDRRLSELQGATGLIGASMNWISFSALAAINVARSKGLRI